MKENILKACHSRTSYSYDMLHGRSKGQVPSFIIQAMLGGSTSMGPFAASGALWRQLHPVGDR